MPATLIKTEDALELDLSTCRGGEFQEVLTKIKEVPGRKYDGKRKMWLAPADGQTAERIIRAIQPEYDPAIMEWVKQSRHTGEQDLVTKLPDDSNELLIPWADKRMPWQPEEINGEPVVGLKPHQRALVANIGMKSIIADDLGLGKSVQALSYVAEFLLKYRHEQERETKTVRERLESKTQRGDSSVQQSVQGTSNTTKATGKKGSSSAEQGQGTTGNSSSDQQSEGSSVRGLRGLASSAMYGLGSYSKADTISDWKLPVDQIVAWEDKATNGRRRASEVRGQMRQLPSAETLASGPKLIVCPRSVTGVWQREIKRWLAEDSITAVGLAASKRSEAIQSAIEEGKWLIVNYEQLRIVKEKQKIRNGGTKIVKVMKEPLFEKTPWVFSIIDESHRLKNRKAAQTQGAYKINSLVTLLLTGTPLMNSPADLWSLLHLLYPKEYTSYWRFFETYVDYVEGYFKKDIVGVKNPDALRFELDGKLYRRTKDEVLDLPEKQRITIPVELDKKSEKLYNEAERSLWLEVETAVQEGDQEAARFAKAASQKLIYQIPNGAARTVRLRQILSSAALLGGEDHSNKMDALVENITDNAHKQHVVFTQFVESCDILAERLRKTGLTVETYNGKTNDKGRVRIENEFQSGDVDVVVGTIDAMREGITLTAADTVHFLERSWVPAWNHQAEDRLHRIGQRNEVTVYIYEAVGTVDDGTVRLTNTLKDQIIKTVLPQDYVKESNG